MIKDKSSVTLCCDDAGCPEEIITELYYKAVIDARGLINLKYDNLVIPNKWASVKGKHYCHNHSYSHLYKYLEEESKRFAFINYIKYAKYDIICSEDYFKQVVSNFENDKYIKEII